jgi:hypothetical protein
MTTYLACHMQLTSYDLFSAPRVVRQQGRICEIRPFTVTHYLVSNMEKGLEKLFILKLQSNCLMYVQENVRMNSTNFYINYHKLCFIVY